MPGRSLVRIVLVICLGFSASQTYAHEGHCEDTKLGEIMSRMKKPYKALKRNSDDFELVASKAKELIALAEEADALTPLKIKKKELSADKIGAYREGLKDMRQLLNSIVLAGEAKNEDEVEQLLAKLNRVRKDGHKTFRLECD